ncbi:7-deoxyloganetin glucosyltransferase [Capsicum annuum]|uniref:7-deoxyloganetin glucosyltransferase n=1 Tax=Capsicum annuum TaxID=4072 RepID=A0A2G2Z2K6_CAPAN|nr:7-deoxyloganetin glucosyltransferase [Capsicum annuum]
MGSIRKHEVLDKPHAVCIPFPVQGHVNPMLRLAIILHHKVFHITFVNTEYNHRRLLKSCDPHSFKGLPFFRFETISDGLPPCDADATQDIPYLCPFKELLVKLNHTSSSDVSPISCIIFGGSMSFTLTAAQDLGIPQVVFWAPSACGLLGIMHYHDLAKNGYFPFKDASDLTNGYLETTLDWILGMKGIYLRDLPSFMRSTNPDDFLFKYLIQETDRCKFASAIVINTFDLLEKEVLESLQALLPPIYMIDPLYFLVKHIEDKNLELLGSNLWKEDLKCLDNGINPQHGNKTQNIRQTEDQNGNKSRPTIIPQERDDTRCILHQKQPTTR